MLVRYCGNQFRPELYRAVMESDTSLKKAPWSCSHLEKLSEFRCSLFFKPCVLVVRNWHVQICFCYYTMHPKSDKSELMTFYEERCAGVN